MEPGLPGWASGFSSHPDEPRVCDEQRLSPQTLTYDVGSEEYARLWDELFAEEGFAALKKLEQKMLSYDYDVDSEEHVRLWEEKFGKYITKLEPDFPEQKGYNSELSTHPDDHRVCDEHGLTPQTLSSHSVPEVLLKEDKSAGNLRFHPYPKRFSTPESTSARCEPQLAPGKVAHDGISITTSNPFGLTDEVICSTSHQVSRSSDIMLHDQSSRPLDIPLQYLKEITDNFSDDRILGHGGSGVVYKGVLQNGDMIAVKKIMSTLMPGLQKKYENEVYHLMMLKHPNIVRCLGYCYEIKNVCLEYNGKFIFAEMAERLLCLEYLPNGSLDKYLSDESSGLDWGTRYKIIEGICYGLYHLHVQIAKPIVHLDLKPTNILLDNSMVPKITDFDLSRLLDQHRTIHTSSRDGTLGYMAPEFLHEGTITPKSDIFSLGVIIMEIITGHRDYPCVSGTSSNDFIKLTLAKWRNVLSSHALRKRGNAVQRSIVYGSLDIDCEQIKRCIQVGLICMNPNRTSRPSMTKVISMLQGSESIDFDIIFEAP